MDMPRHEMLPIQTEADVVRVRQCVRVLATTLGFRLVDQTKLVTAASELARNALVHGQGGTAVLEVLHERMRTGLRITFEDNGPGIADVAQALQDGYSTGTGLGLGLGGAQRLVDTFEIRSRPGLGTWVRITRWK